MTYKAFCTSDTQSIYCIHLKETIEKTNQAALSNTCSESIEEQIQFYTKEDYCNYLKSTNQRSLYNSQCKTTILPNIFASDVCFYFPSQNYYGQAGLPDPDADLYKFSNCKPWPWNDDFNNLNYGNLLE